MKRDGFRFSIPAGLTGLVLFACLSVAPTARADPFAVSAIISSVEAPGTAVFTGPGTGAVHGSLDINIATGVVTGASLVVSGEPGFNGTYSLLQNCNTTTACKVVDPSLYGSALYLDFASSPTTLVGYGGGLLVADSAFYVLPPPTFRSYLLSGTVTAPEPSFYAAMAIGMSGLLFAVRRRRRA